MQRLYENLFYSKPVNDLFKSESFINFMLRVEAALASAQAEHGFIPVSAAKVIESCCKIENIQVELLIDQTPLGGNVNIPFVRQLTHAVAIQDAEAAKYVHLGVTSQDILDTATALQLRQAFTFIKNDLDLLIGELIELTKVHRNTLMIGRSFMQHARPITFGFKVAGWLDGLLRSRKRIEKVLLENFQLQLGGAVGTLSGFEGKGLAIAETMSSTLQLNVPSIPWHTQRDNFTEAATTLGLLSGIVGKIAKDISLLMQPELAEVSEPATPGKGGSSSMPHKRNPVGCIAIISNSIRIPAMVSTMLSTMAQDHERGTGGWHAEWETIADIVQLTAGAVHQANSVIKGLEVNTEKMRNNIELTQGLIYAENVSLALAKHIGKEAAHGLLEILCKEAALQKIHLRTLVQENKSIGKYLSSTEINNLFSPENSIGMCEVWIDRILRMPR